MIDTNPQVGRIVVRRSDVPQQYVDPVCIGRITAVSGERITYQPKGGGRETFILRKKILAVLDTDDELLEIMSFDTAYGQACRALEKDFENRWSQVLGVSQ